MEATIQSNNQAINIDINVSINVDALKTIIQRGCQATWKAIKQCVLMAIKQATKKCCNVGAAVRTVDLGNVLSNLWIGGWSVACFYLIYMYA